MHTDCWPTYWAHCLPNPNTCFLIEEPHVKTICCVCALQTELCCINPIVHKLLPYFIYSKQLHKVTGATRSCSNKKILEEAGWDSLETRREKHRLITFHKMVHQNSPSYLYTLVPPSVHQVSQRNLRSQNDLHIPRSRTNLYRDSFIPKTSKDWNALPENIRRTQSLGEFRRFLDRNKKIIENYYFFGNRKSQILHARLRLRCNSLGSDLYRNHLSNTCMYCNKCNCPETAEHYLLHCRKFYSERTLTINEINVATNVDTLLKGCPMYDDITNRDIFSAVQEYIRLTKRFDT